MFMITIRIRMVSSGGAESDFVFDADVSSPTVREGLHDRSVARALPYGRATDTGPHALLRRY